MHEVVVLGGYGRVGQTCVAELVRNTSARIVLAGRSIQLAERIASAHGDRARPVYCNTEDLRTLQRLIPGAAAIVDCCGANPLNVLDVTIQARVPFIGLTSPLMDENTRSQLQTRAWDAQVPVVLSAGAVPGLPGVLAEYLVRCFPSLFEIRIAATGPWLGTKTAQLSQKEQRSVPEWGVRRWRLLRWHFPQPIGWRWVRPGWSADLTGFVERHCVERLTYLEPDVGSVARGLGQILQQEPTHSFSLVAEAAPERSKHDLRRRIAVQASDTLSAAAAATGVLLRRILRGKMPGGFFTPREILNPAVFLEQLEKRGLRVMSSLAAG